MPSYQVFIPHVRGADPQHLVRAGLGDILDPSFAPTGFDVLQNGPGEQPGVCFTWQSSDTRFNPRPGVHADGQLWLPAKPKGELAPGRFWLGRELGKPVEPASLLRRATLASAPVKLDDGQEWFVPIATRLPHRYGLNDEGQEARIVIERYRAFYEKAEEFYNLFLNIRGGIQPGFTLPGAFAFGVQCLQLNYRVNADVLDFLELFSEVALIRAIGATFELAALEEVERQKKNQEA